MEPSHLPRTVVALSSMAILGTMGAVGLGVWYNHHKFLDRIGAVHSYVSREGPLEFSYNGQNVRAFEENGLGFEFNRRISAKSAMYEVLVQGASKFGKDVVKSSLGMRREGDTFNMENQRKLPEFSDVVIDHDLNGVDKGDTYKEFKYDPTLEGKNGKKGYVEKVKSMGKVAKGVLDAARGKEPDPLEEPKVVVNRETTIDAPFSNIRGRKREFVRREYKDLVKEACKVVPDCE